MRNNSSAWPVGAISIKTLPCFASKQIKDAEDGKDFVHAGRDHVHERGEDFFFKSKINMQAAGLHAGSGGKLLLDARCPAAKLKDRVHFHGGEAGIAEDRNHLVADILLENIIKRRRRVSGAHRDVNIFIQRP